MDTPALDILQTLEGMRLVHKLNKQGFRVDLHDLHTGIEIEEVTIPIYVMGRPDPYYHTTRRVIKKNNDK